MRLTSAGRRKGEDKIDSSIIPEWVCSAPYLDFHSGGTVHASCTRRTWWCNRTRHRCGCLLMTNLTSCSILQEISNGVSVQRIISRNGPQSRTGLIPDASSPQALQRRSICFGHVHACHETFHGPLVTTIACTANFIAGKDRGGSGSSKG